MKNDKQLRISWLFLMAWRDSRRNRSRLFLFVSAIILGIAALVATLSFGYNFRDDIDAQAKTLVGADLVIGSNHPAPTQLQSILDTLHNQHSEECSFASMVYFVKGQGTRLVQVRALDGDYPFYGELETTPEGAGRTFRNERQALVEKTLMLQYQAHVGDSIKIGALTFEIAGILNKAPGRNEISTTVAPPVYIPFRYLAETGLLQRGSRVEYQLYYKYDDGTDVESFVDSIRPRLEKAGVSIETVESRKRQMGRAFGDFSQFLTLISFIALLLGCIGVASAVHIYIREKINTIAVLRCLGVKAWQAFIIYLVQVAGIGLIGSVLGTAMGIVVQQVLPVVLKDLLPLEASVHISWWAIGQGVLTGMLISILFALIPLLSIRNISPLYTLRLPFETARMAADPLKWLVYAAIFLFVAFFSFRQMNSWSKALAFSGSIFAAFLLLAIVARLLMWLVRRSFPASWNYLWRQGFANLYRPNNQTLILVITIGLGAMFMGTLYFVQSMLIERVTLSSGISQGNMVVFDIQTGQQQAVDSLAKQYRIALLQEVPVVTMRIEKIMRTATIGAGRSDGAAAGPTLRAGASNGAPGREEDSLTGPGEGQSGNGDRERGGDPGARRGTSKKDGRGSRDQASDARSGRNRAVETEIRVTYRDSLMNSEKIMAGKLWTRINSAQDRIAISLEEDYARRISVKMGDTILFNVQGLPVTTVVGSLRQVDWRRMETNFRVVFPVGVLEAAPQFHVLVARVPSSEVSARFQQALVRGFPNVSVIDLELVLRVLDDILDKIGFVIRFMAGFSILTGLIVLIASVLISKYQRIQETVLLRTLGASRRQILVITMLEYFFLGGLAAATGIVLSLACSEALARYIFEASFVPHWRPVLILFASVCGPTILIGLYNSRGVLNRPPLEVLRSEV
jgi:putative ABC transport system permease protein